MQLLDKAKGIFAFVKGLVVSTTKWAKTIPSEPNGNGSSSRMIALMVTVTTTGLLIAFFRVHHDLPTPGQLYALSAILGTGIGAYAANQIRHKDDDHPDDPPQGGSDADTTHQ